MRLSVIGAPFTGSLPAAICIFLVPGFEGCCSLFPMFGSVLSGGLPETLRVFGISSAGILSITFHASGLVDTAFGDVSTRTRLPSEIGLRPLCLRLGTGDNWSVVKYADGSHGIPEMLLVRGRSKLALRTASSFMASRRSKPLQYLEFYAILQTVESPGPPGLSPYQGPVIFQY